MGTQSMHKIALVIIFFSCLIWACDANRSSSSWQDQPVRLVKREPTTSIRQWFSKKATKPVIKLEEKPEQVKPSSEVIEQPCWDQEELYDKYEPFHRMQTDLYPEVYQDQSASSSHGAMIPTVENKVEIINRLMSDLKGIPNVDGDLENWKSRCQSRKLNFWDIPAQEGAIPWDFPPIKSDLSRLRRDLAQTAMSRRRPGNEYWVEILLNHDDKLLFWPKLKEPIYSYFGVIFEDHLQKARDLRDQYEDLLSSSKVSQANRAFKRMETHILMAWDIFKTMKMTYRNLLVEQLHSITRENNIRAGRAEDWLNWTGLGDAKLISKTCKRDVS